MGGQYNLYWSAYQINIVSSKRHGKNKSKTSPRIHFCNERIHEHYSLFMSTNFISWWEGKRIIKTIPVRVSLHVFMMKADIWSVHIILININDQLYVTMSIRHEQNEHRALHLYIITNEKTMFMILIVKSKLCIPFYCDLEVVITIC